MRYSTKHAAYYALLALFLVAALEAAARFLGFSPLLRPMKPGVSLLVPDAETGWIHRPGAYTIERESGEQVRFTIGKDGARSNGELSNPATDARTPDSPILMVGGSFMIGSQYLNDSETLPALLQRRVPNSEIKNFGTFAYGTYQSYLLLQRLIDQFPNTQGVTYGFVDFHEHRNVGAQWWHAGLQRRSSQPVRLPYTLIEKGGNLKEFRPEAYPNVGLARNSALVSALSDAWVRYTRFQTNNDRQAATIRIINRMQKLLREREIPLLVAFLASVNQPKQVYTDLLNSANIPFVECVSHSVSPEMMLPEDGHPSVAMNAQWADCVAESWASE